MKTTALYVRKSTSGQKYQAQLHAVRNKAAEYAGEPVWYKETAGGAADERPVLDRLTEDVKRGMIDRIVIYALDRVSRKGIADGLRRLQAWLDAGAEVVSVCEPWVVSTADGGMRDLLLSIAFWGASQERNRLRERTQAAMDAIKATGRTRTGNPVGRPVGCRSPWKKRKVDVEFARTLRERGVPVREIAERFDVTPAAVYQALKA